MDEYNIPARSSQHAFCEVIIVKQTSKNDTRHVAHGNATSTVYTIFKVLQQCISKEAKTKQTRYF